MFKKPDDLKRLDRLIVEREKELGAPLTPSPVLSLRTRLKGALLALAGSFATPRREDELPVGEMRFSPEARMDEDPDALESHTARIQERPISTESLFPIPAIRIRELLDLCQDVPLIINMMPRRVRFTPHSQNDVDADGVPDVIDGGGVVDAGVDFDRDGCTDEPTRKILYPDREVDVIVTEHPDQDLDGIPDSIDICPSGIPDAGKCK